MATFPATVTVACPACGADVAVPITAEPTRDPLGVGRDVLVVKLRASPVAHTCRTPRPPA